MYPDEYDLNKNFKPTWTGLFLGLMFLAGGIFMVALFFERMGAGDWRGWIFLPLGTVAYCLGAWGFFVNGVAES